MIARVWRGWTRGEDADAYVDYLQQTGAPASLGTPGNRGFTILHRPDGEREELDAFRQAIRESGLGSLIQREEEIFGPTTGGFRGFEIVR